MRYLLSAEERQRLLGFDDRWMLLVGIPLLALLSQLFFVRPDQLTEGRSLVACLSVGFFYVTTYWLILRAVTVELRARYDREEDTLKRVALMLVTSLVVIFLVELVADRLIGAIAPPEIARLFSSVPKAFATAVSFVLCALVLAVYESIFFFTKFRQSRLEQERLERANVQSQLAALKQQVNPHFLFNSLNTLTTLIPEDTALATRFVQRLSAVYRRLLEYRHESLIPLSDELTALEDYLFLLRARFEDKLRVEINGRATAADRLLPPLTLQLLVENAIKHNVVSTARPLTVRIDITADYVTVSNNLQERPRAAAGTGVGQANITQRYRLLSDRPVRVERAEDRYRVAVPLLTPSLSHAPD